MITWEDFRDKNTEITEVDGKFYCYLEGYHFYTATEYLEAKDFIEDAATERLKEDWKYECDFCNAFFQEEEIEHRIEDNSFTAPYGEIFVLGKDVSSIPICPICSGDMEETK